MSDEKTTRLDEAVDGALRRIAASEARPDLRARVSARLRRPAPASGMPLRLALAAAAAVLVVIAGALRVVSPTPPGPRTVEGPPVTELTRALVVSAPSPSPSVVVPAPSSRPRPVATPRAARIPLPGAPPALHVDALPSPDSLGLAPLDEPALAAKPVAIAALSESELSLQPLSDNR